MSSSTTGSNQLPNLHEYPYIRAVGSEDESFGGSMARFRDKMLRTHAWLADLLTYERRESYNRGLQDAQLTTLDRAVSHVVRNPDIPAPFIEALQRGPGNPGGGSTFTIGGHDVMVTFTAEGTGIPEPSSQAVWEKLTRVIEETTARPYCADVVAPLPREIAALVWNAERGIVVVASSLGGERPARPVSAARRHPDGRRN